MDQRREEEEEGNILQGIMESLYSLTITHQKAINVLKRRGGRALSKGSGDSKRGNGRDESKAAPFPG